MNQLVQFFFCYKVDSRYGNKKKSSCEWVRFENDCYTHLHDGPNKAMALARIIKISRCKNGQESGKVKTGLQLFIFFSFFFFKSLDISFFYW